MRDKILNFVNPIARLGKRNYSIVIPLIVTTLAAVGTEWYAETILHNQEAGGLFALFLFIALIIYFSFRDGIPGGITTVIITLLYYSYIIETGETTNAEKKDQWETAFILALLYVSMALIIGWLKQTIDALINREADERRRLEAVIRQLPTGVIITDGGGKVIQVNQKVSEILDTTIPIGAVIGSKRYVNAYKNGKYVEASETPLAQALLAEKSTFGQELTIKRKDGTEQYVRISAAPIHNNEGKIIAAASIIHDITRRKEMEARKDDFINMASHELKSPITSLLLYIDVLKKRIEKNNVEQAITTLTSVRNQIKKLQQLASNLLDVSRLQTDKFRFSKEAFRIDQFIVETANELQHTVQQKIKLLKTTPITVHADKIRIFQVITNIITNAAKYSPAKSTIDIVVLEKEKYAVVSITDYGIGVAKEQQKKIFERLYQVTNSKANTFPGLGMGLYIAKQIVEWHGGTIWVTSQKGKGATFSFSLPLQK